MRTTVPALLLAALVIIPAACAPGQPGQGTGGPDLLPVAPAAALVSVGAQGRYTITFGTFGTFGKFGDRAWTFGGDLGVPPRDIAQRTGSDAIGPYHETTFSYADPGAGARSAGIRAYDTQPVVLFTQSQDAAGKNQAPFPTLSTYPRDLYHLSYRSVEFSPSSFTEFGADSPWAFFDGHANAFILSAAAHFMNASTTMSKDGTISCGIDPAIATLPAGFSHRTVLVVQPGINRAFDTWGHALTSLSGKKRPASDATTELARFGYWTDNGASYYYNYDKGKGYQGTLLAVRDAFQQEGIALGYMQIDSWWYPKGPMADWHDVLHGIYTYTADKTLFSDGLPAFRKDLGLPLVTHARWIDPQSPYRAMYRMSNNVSVDPAYWDQTADYLQQGGVITYEQDWLDVNALPRTDNLDDQDAFLSNMSRSMAARGLSMQYCMPLPRHHLQGSLYDNLVTARVSPDRFNRDRWHDMLYTSRLASALSTWPWVDVFMSGEADNLLLGNLSAGMLGVGDALDRIGGSKAGLLKAIRPDGVIVKPDAPIVPLDTTYVHGAQVAGTPVIGATYSDHAGMRASYVFAYSVGANLSASFTPAALGHSGQVYVYNPDKDTGRVIDAGQAYTEDISGGRAYFIVVSMGPSGIALLGDRDKFVSLGKQRISSWSDQGTLSATIVFADGEGPVTIQGHAPRMPMVSASAGSAGPVMYDQGSQLFRVVVSQAGGMARIGISLP